MNNKEGLDDPQQWVKIDTTKCSAMPTEYFVSKNTRRFFACVYLSQEFLKYDPEERILREDFMENLKTVQLLRVVNDNAERGVALIDEYSSILTKKESQKLYLLQVVKDHRHHFQDCDK